MNIVFLFVLDLFGLGRATASHLMRMAASFVFMCYIDKALIKEDNGQEEHEKQDG
jgi:hypothetical protein